MNSTYEGVIGVNSELQVYFMNTSAKKLLGFNFDKKKTIPLKRITNNDTHAEKTPYHLIKKSLFEGVRLELNSDYFYKENGQALAVQYSASPIIENQKITGTIIVFTDNTERLEYEKKLNYLALFDSLTNLPNRPNVISHIDKAIARAQRNQTPFSICFIDIDKFKSINDTYGHHIGDKALIHVAELISKIIRKNDFFGRLSGDEFCLILDGISEQADIDNALYKIEDALKTPLVTEGKSILIRLSIGVVQYTTEKNPEEILIKADKAMYEVKNKQTRRWF